MHAEHKVQQLKNVIRQYCHNYQYFLKARDDVGNVIPLRCIAVGSTYPAEEGNQAMGKGGTAKRRRRQQKENVTSEAVLDGVAQAAAEERVLGIKVDGSVPNSALFVEDRSGVDKASVKAEIAQQEKQQRLERKRERRAAPAVRRSEAALANTSRVKPIQARVPGKKKMRVAGVDLALIEKKNFKRRSKRAKDVIFGRDVWNSDLAEDVKAQKGVVRKRVETKVNAAVRAAKTVLHPADGLSVNPTFEGHQDMLGEAVAAAIEKKDENEWQVRNARVNPQLLAQKQAAQEREDVEKLQEERMRETDEEEEEVANDEEAILKRTAPERKTRTQRNREKRKKASDFHRSQKIAKRRMHEDFKNLEKIAQEAILEADKLNGEAKKRALAQNPPPKPDEGAPLLKEIAKEKVETEASARPITLSSELAINMRSVQMPISNPVVRDRFLSFQRRGLVEPSGVLRKEARQAEGERRRHELRDRKRRKGRGSRSDLSYWRQGQRKRS